MGSQIAAFVKRWVSRSTDPDTARMGPLVLIVDDEEPIRRFVERVLRAAGCRTAVAADGVEALAVAATLDSLDLLLTDLMMPNMNGDELARQLRAKTPDLPVLYLTAFADFLFTNRMLLWEGEAFLDKPCSVQGLLEAVALARTGHANARAAAV